MKPRTCRKRTEWRSDAPTVQSGSCSPSAPSDQLPIIPGCLPAADSTPDPVPGSWIHPSGASTLGLRSAHPNHLVSQLLRLELPPLSGDEGLGVARVSCVETVGLFAVDLRGAQAAVDTLPHVGLLQSRFRVGRSFSVGLCT